MSRSLKKLFPKTATHEETTDVAIAQTHTENSSDMSTGFDFTRLPAELRVKVYKEILRSAEFDDTADACRSNYHGIQGKLSITVVSVQTALTPTGTLISRAADVLNLRLTNHSVKNEVDYEITQYTVVKVKEAIRTVYYPLGYCSSLQNTLRNSFWDMQPLIRIEPEPKTYKDVQNLHITTYVSDIHCSGDLGNEELSFLDTLAPHVRSLTLNMAVPEHVVAMPEQRMRGIVGEGVETLTLHMYKAMYSKAWLEQPLENMQVPADGVVRVQINFPAGHSYARLDLCELPFFLDRGLGLQGKTVMNEEGRIVGVVFAYAGVGKTKTNKKTKRERIMERVKASWAKVTKWASKKNGSPL